MQVISLKPELSFSSFFLGLVWILFLKGKKLLPDGAHSCLRIVEWGRNISTQSNLPGNLLPENSFYIKKFYKI